LTLRLSELPYFKDPDLIKRSRSSTQIEAHGYTGTNVKIKFFPLVLLRSYLNLYLVTPSPNRRAPKLRVRPGSRGLAPPHFLYKLGGLVRASGSRLGFRRPAMWAQCCGSGPFWSDPDPALNK
jgi:hypothetical protein